MSGAALDLGNFLVRLYSNFSDTVLFFGKFKD